MKTTKQSIMTSLVAILVLISMFVGTTFAWFTDIVTSKDNVIQAGMLDTTVSRTSCLYRFDIVVMSERKFYVPICPIGIVKKKNDATVLVTPFSNSILNCSSD